MDFAERLSLWLGPLEAIALQATHQGLRAMQAPAAAPPPERPCGLTAAAQDLQRLRALLAGAIAQPVADAQEGDAGCARYIERHLALQRQMELAIAPLRAHLRELASRHSARLRQLATLDAAMEQVLAARGQALLARLPACLKRRFAQLRAGAAAEGNADWLQAFDRAWRQALLAELEVRLAPLAGLVEAAAEAWDDTR